MTKELHPETCTLSYIWKEASLQNQQQSHWPTAQMFLGEQNSQIQAKCKFAQPSKFMVDFSPPIQHAFQEGSYILMD